MMVILHSATEQSLRNAGYTSAFTYFNNNNKHFVIYNKQEGKILSDIPSFSGDTVINNDVSSITFDNGNKVNVVLIQMVTMFLMSLHTMILLPLMKHLSIENLLVVSMLTILSIQN